MDKRLRIKIALLKLGISQTEIARKLGKTDSAISRVISGERASKEINAYIEELISRKAA